MVPTHPEQELLSDMCNLLVYEEGHLGIPLNLLKHAYEKYYFMLLHSEEANLSAQGRLSFCKLIHWTDSYDFSVERLQINFSSATPIK